MKESSHVLPPKKDVCLALLEKATVFVHLDPRHEGVAVPPWFRRQPQLVLQLGHMMAKPIVDLAVSDHAITCTLSFSNSPFACCLPWDAIFALVGEDGRGMVWPTDVPPEVTAQLQQQPTPDATLPAPVKPLPKRTRAPRATGGPSKLAPAPLPSIAKVEPLRRPKPEASAPVAPLPPSSADAPVEKKRKRELPSYLRIVK